MPFEIDEPRKGKVAAPKAKGGTKTATPPAPDASNNGLIPPPGVPAPPGFLWVFNRLNIPFERPFDGLIQRIEPHGYQLFSLEVANHLYRHSLILDQQLWDTDPSLRRSGGDDLGRCLADSEAD